ncbi:MAG: DUF6299 family protein [Candidatus Limnocylindria bacterium]
MSRTKFLIALITIASVLFSASPALAAPGPSNDKIAGATAITALPFSDTVDTTKATTDAEEDAAAQPCRDFGAPAIEKAVWYKYTASADITLSVDTTASSYTTGIARYKGAPSASTFVTCAPGRLITSVASGQTAYLMIFGDQPGSPGGTLRINVQEAPPPPQVSLTVDPVGGFDSSGNATISGTVTCTGTADFGGINGNVTQTVGRFTINGFFFSSFTCDGTTQPWTATTQSSNGKFAGGPATVQAFAFACNVSGCGQDSVTQQVRLRK